MKKITLVLVFLSTIFLLGSTTSYAQSPSADTPIATNSDTVKKELQDRIKSVVDEQFKTSEEKLNNKTTDQGNRTIGVVGHITEIKDTIIEINSRADTYQIKTSETTVLVKSGKNVKIADLSIQDRIIAIGTIDGRNIINAKRIVVVPTPEYTKTPVYLKVVAINETKKVVTALNLIDNTSIEFTLGKKIKFTLADLKENQTIIGVFLTGGTYKTPVLILGKLL